MLDIAAEPRLPHARLFGSRSFTRHPCHPERSDSPVMSGAADPCYPARPAPPLRASPATQRRCLSPTSATDQLHEYPEYRSTPRLERLAAPSAQVKGSVDAVPPASAELSTLSFIHEERSATPERRLPLRRRFRPLAELEARPLTLPVAHRYLPREAGRPASQDRFRRTPVKGHDLHDPKRLPSTGAPSRPACACCVGTRHRSRGFATAEPASGDLLRYPELAPGTAAPSCHPRLITTGSTVQVRRLSTSAITTVLEHDSGFDLNTPLNA